MTDLSILNEQNLRVLLGELSDWWRHMMEHQGINETNYFMYDEKPQSDPRPPHSVQSSCISTKPVYSTSSVT